MKILSIRAPWWWHILHDRKDIENRTWASDYTGPLLIHASKFWSRSEVEGDFESARIMTNRKPEPLSPVLRDTMRACGGQIVGLVQMVGCDCAMDFTDKRPHPSPWFVGDFGFKLAQPIAFREGIPFKARLGLIDAPPEIITEVQRQLR